MKTITCKEAKLQGLKRYFTGKPCKHGHIAERHVSGGCVVCANLDQKRYYDQNPEKYLQANRDFHQRSEVRERNKLRQRKFYAENTDLCKAISSKARAARMQRVPSWFEEQEIKNFYAACPEGYEVDHIYPLQGKKVSGLHVLGNLQYLPMSENRSKHNRFEPC